MSEWTKVGERPTVHGNYWMEWPSWNVVPVIIEPGIPMLLRRVGCNDEIGVGSPDFNDCRWLRAEYPEPPPRKDVFDEIAGEYLGEPHRYLDQLADHLRKNAGRIRGEK